VAATRLGHVAIDAGVGGDAPGTVVGQSLQFDARGLVLEFIPFAFEVLFEEVSIADPANFAGDAEVAGESLAMLPEEAVAVVFLGDEAAPIEAQVVEAAVFDSPVVELAGSGPRDAEEIAAGILDVGAVSPAAFAEIVETGFPFGAGGTVAPAEDLEHVPIGEDLGSEDAVFLEADSLDVEGRFFEIGCRGWASRRSARRG
jgi:hypothetical protein